VDLKKTDCPWLYEVSAHIGQQALADLDKAFERFFTSLRREGQRSGFPRFKRKGEHDSCRVYGVALAERHLRLPKIGHVRLKETRSQRGFEGRILSATITRRADRWFCSLTVEREREMVAPRSVMRATDVVGVDLGLKAAAVIHDGSETRTIAPTHALQRNLIKLVGSTGSWRASNEAHGTVRRRSCVAQGSTTRSPASGRTSCITFRASWRKPSR
jgi:putative transposase